MTEEKNGKTIQIGNIWGFVLQQLQQQGLSFLLLGFAVWYLNGRVNFAENRYLDCQNDLIEIYRTETAITREIISKNTETNKRILELLKDKK
jgi:ABC-type cobalamin transport system ATPase subunit